MAYNFKEEMNKPERLTGGHRLCAGCGAGVAVRGVLRALKGGKYFQKNAKVIFSVVTPIKTL